MFLRVVWDEDDDPLGNVQHIAEHGLLVDEVEAVLSAPETHSRSESSGLPCCFGYTPTGEYIIVIYEEIDADSIYVVTAYQVSEPGGSIR